MGISVKSTTKLILHPSGAVIVHSQDCGNGYPLGNAGDVIVPSGSVSVVPHALNIYIDIIHKHIVGNYFYTNILHKLFYIYISTTLVHK